ncbi:hypothetical protein Aspvir_009611 [Aspergillus viridinutans]|uniref:F-box domain-containing protein n=1 Tax=Aspergillus viridinutans TaxID=75553 RepID=A0A9P3BZT5_ASPVI|nr:uncharacterized protein Aspvir_009611 [Aspergillus viridinutans]GIK05498.1 hypothetical protein Aspvir_009611 [Aspergillus viridinutans]
MAYDCYCAICGVGFCGMLIETPSETGTERRRRWIEKRSQALQAGQPIDQVPQDGEEPVRSYDPKIVGWENVAWLYKAYCLGFNPQAASGKGKTFVSGPGYYADAGEIAIKSGTDAVPGQDRNVYTCYGSGTDDTPGPVLPFHGCCFFEILTRVLTGSTDSSAIDMRILYNVMTELSNESSSTLRLNYGDDIRRAQGRYWECIPGAEASSHDQVYCATHPTETSGLADFLKTNMATDGKFKKSFSQFDLKGRSPASPFGKLPLELVYQICSYLPGDSLKALTQASLSIQVVTQDNWFWKRFIQWDMPWFWEFYSSQNPRDLPADVNYKRLYLWLDKMTAARYGMDDLALIGVANRRRIWGVCEELASQYHRAVAAARSAEAKPATSIRYCLGIVAGEGMRAPVLGVFQGSLFNQNAIIQQDKAKLRSRRCRKYPMPERIQKASFIADHHSFETAEDGLDEELNWSDESETALQDNSHSPIRITQDELSLLGCVASDRTITNSTIVRAMGLSRDIIDIDSYGGNARVQAG